MGFGGEDGGPRPYRLANSKGGAGRPRGARNSGDAAVSRRSSFSVHRTRGAPHQHAAQRVLGITWEAWGRWSKPFRAALNR